jgi:hypothetical protein
MKFPAASTLVVIALLAAGALAKADEKTVPAALQQFEALKKLAGDWVEIGKDGKATDKLVSSIRVTSAGSAVQEILFPGSDHEMVTMYHLDGADLVLTHYCALGNQPRMRAEPGTETNKIAFKFIGATNLKSADEQHMNEATLTIAGTNRLQAEWVSCKEGKTCHQVKFDLVRKQK